MKKALLIVLAIALAPFSAFAVDGVMLINQATVTAAGGFPYVISVPGSYKLSGNLQVTGGVDGIQIASSNVTLDLNGFSISSVDGSSSHTLVRAVGAIMGVTVRNGILSATSNIELNFFSSAGGTVLEDLTLLHLSGGGNVFLGSSIVRRVSSSTAIQVTCPALVVDSIAAFFHSITTSSTACTYGFISGSVI
jgi:hypothetical protein